MKVHPSGHALRRPVPLYLANAEQEAPLSFIAYSPDGRHIFSGSLTRRFEYGMRSVAYSPDGRYIISGFVDKTIRMWDAKTGSAVGKPFEGHTGSVWSVAYSPDGRRIISGSVDKTIRIWDAVTGSQQGVCTFRHTYCADFLRFHVAHSPDGRRLISGSAEKTIRIWDAETGSAFGSPLEGYTGYVRSKTTTVDL